MGDSHDISKQVKVYLAVFGALLVGTVLTVAMYYVHFESVAVTVTIALVIATIKASLVGAYFMHLISEKTTIYAVMVTTVFFFAALMGLTLFSMGDIPQMK
jgi:cytochrome c oxidase subunit 4